MNISKFARQIGVSPTTVSHTLSGHRHVKPATRQLIETKMRELGFTPNLNARRLSKGATDQIALVFVNPEALIDPYAMLLANAILQPVKAQGYSLQLHVVDRDPANEETLLHLAKAKGVDGMILVGGSLFRQECLEELSRLDFPCVIVDDMPVPQRPGMGAVLMRAAGGVREAARLLAGFGHTRIAMIHRGGGDAMPELFRHELAAFRLALSPDLLTASGPSLLDGDRAMSRLLDQPDPPTAVFCRTDNLALGAMHAIKHRGLCVPGDLSVVGHDNLPIAELADPPLTTVRADVERLGTEACKQIFRRLAGHPMPARPVWVDTRLALRQSVGPAKIRLSP